MSDSVERPCWSQLKEWVTTVAGAAGVSPGDARLATGQIGSRESLLELEILFFSLAARGPSQIQHACLIHFAVAAAGRSPPAHRTTHSASGAAPAADSFCRPCDRRPPSNRPCPLSAGHGDILLLPPGPRARRLAAPPRAERRRHHPAVGGSPLRRPLAGGDCSSPG